jgi:phosphoribosylformylglycinamidine synthase
VSIDGNGRRVACEPYAGTVETVLECAANLAAVGAEPLGLTNCLNFGNPEKPHIAWQLTEAVRGLGDACRAVAAPVVGGNVSLYNEGSEGPIYPTPVVGMVGSLPDPAAVPGMGFRAAGHEIALVGPFEPAREGSELEKLSGELADRLPEVDLERQSRAIAVVRDAVRDGLVASAHDVSEGGLGVALAECCIAGVLGARVAVADLFGEGPGGFVVSGEPEALAELERRAAEIGFVRLGSVGGDALEVSVEQGETGADDRLAEASSTATLRIAVADLAAAFESGIPAKFS